MYCIHVVRSRVVFDLLSRLVVSQWPRLAWQSSCSAGCAIPWSDMTWSDVGTACTNKSCSLNRGPPGKSWKTLSRHSDCPRGGDQSRCASPFSRGRLHIDSRHPHHRRRIHWSGCPANSRYWGCSRQPVGIGVDRGHAAWTVDRTRKDVEDFANRDEVRRGRHSQRSGCRCCGHQQLHVCKTLYPSPTCDMDIAFCRRTKLI